MDSKKYYDSPDCIEKLISKQEKYPYYYWFIWIFFLVLFAGALGVRASNNFDIKQDSIKSEREDRQEISKNNAYSLIMNKAKSEQKFLIKALEQYKPIICKK